MTKTKEELTNLKKECDALTNKLRELSQDELSEVIGGAANFNGSFTRSITLISASLFGKSVNVNEVLTSGSPNNSETKNGQ